MIEIVVAGIVVLAIIGFAVWRPEATVMCLGVFLFVQSAVIRLEPAGPQLREIMARLDEVVLLGLLVRTGGVMLMRRRVSIPLPLWPLVAFGLIGGVSALANTVAPIPAALGIYLSLKGGLWLFVALHLNFDQRRVVQYGYVIGGLFLGAVLIAVAQFAGVSMPWQPHVRPSGDLAATSIWNQHTVFGSAMAVAVGMAVAALRLPGERWAGTALAVISVVGILLSSVRRLLISLPLAALAAAWALPGTERERLRSAWHLVRRPAILAAGAVGLLLLAVVVGPRLARLAGSAWSQYVVDLGSHDRYLLYDGAVQLLEGSPLLGRGPGTYGSYVTVLFESPAYTEVGVHLRDGLKMGAPYASLAGEYGLYGVVAFAAFVILLIRQLLPLARSAAGTVHAALASAGIFMLVDMSIESIVHVTFSNSFIAFFAFVGIGAAIRLGAAERQPPAAAWEPASISPRWRLGAVLAALAGMGLVVGLALLLRA